MLIRKAYRYRFYPNTAQELHLAVNFGQARFMYNHFLAEHKRYYTEQHDDPVKRGLNYYENANALKGLIGIEDLHVRGMVRNRRLARAITDAGRGTLRRQWVYKGLWYGTQVVSVGSFFPSSRRCSACGRVLPELSLSAREWDCPECSAHHDRDLNAAINIKMEAQTRAIHPPEGTPVERV